VSDEVIGIHVSQSHDNQIFNNMISDSMNAIDAHIGSSNNRIYNNTIIKSVCVTPQLAFKSCLRTQWHCIALSTIAIIRRGYVKTHRREGSYTTLVTFG
jgi:parallel beta-helix repeat protein